MPIQYLRAFSSAILWGSGQFLNKQYLKGFILLIFEAILLGIELLTGNWVAYFLGNDLVLKDAYGYFTKGLWGLITLGETSGVIGGDNSIILLANGLIVLTILLMFLFIYIWNIKDAYQTCIKMQKENRIINSQEYFNNFKTNMFEYIFLFPAMILILFFAVLPLIFSILIGFTNYNAHNLPPANLVEWVGFENFINFFKLGSWSQTFLGVLRWTFIWAIISTVSVFFMGFFLALLVNHPKVKWKGLWRTIYILPWAIPAMISLLIFKEMFNTTIGPVNRILLDFNLIASPIPWLTDPLMAKITLILVNLWLGMAYFMMLMSGVLVSIDKTLYESAKIDGASGWHILKKITFPLVLFATAPLLIITFAGNFNNFGAVFFLTGGGPVNEAFQFAGHTDILITWIYKLTMDMRMYNMATVMSIFVFIIIGSVSLWSFLRTKTFKEEDML